jgi:hypothetical protein
MNGFTKTGIPKRVSVAMRGWTKWGGPNHGYFTITPEWYCQCCKELQTDQLPAYLINMEDNEVARVCSKCFNTAIMKHIENIFDLIKLLRGFEESVDNILME